MLIIILLGIIVLVPRSYFPQGELKGEVINIGPNNVDCFNPFPGKCWIINGEKSYQQIEGFEYEEGYSYFLEVKITEIENPPADASSLRYDLIKVISKTKV